MSTVARFVTKLKLGTAQMPTKSQMDNVWDAHGTVDRSKHQVSPRYETTPMNVQTCHPRSQTQTSTCHVVPFA